jgi:hypothetical protein
MACSLPYPAEAAPMALYPTPAPPRRIAGRCSPLAAALKAGLAVGSLVLLGSPLLVPGEAWAQGAEKAVSPVEPLPAQADGAGKLAPSPPVQQVVDLVHRAAEAVRQQGESTFDAFRRRGGPWFQGENYVVVLGADGRSVVYPPDRRGEGLNYEDFEDIGGKPFGRQFLAVGDTPTGRGWVHYQWRRPNPADRRPVWKATYLERVTAPSGRAYLVLSGLYEPPMEPLFVVDAVEGASRLLQRQGRQAFPALRDPRGPFFYQDTYVFVLAVDGRMLLNPAFPALEGRTLESWPDPGDRSRVRASLQKALQSGSTWTTYRWPRPGSTVPVEAKSTYLRTVMAPGGEVLLVGSGLYVLP